MNNTKMRRAEKKLSDSDTFKIINKAKYGILSLSDENSPYGVPLSPALCGDKLYFHCANEGLKLDIISKNPRGHFVFVSKAKILSEKATVDYKSAMVYGTLRVVDSASERKTAYEAIVARYMKKFPEAAAQTIEKSDAKTTLVAMDIKGMSGKASSKGKSKVNKTNISTPIEIKGRTVRNRIVMPPLVLIHTGREKGKLNKTDYKHYISRARHGAGIIVVEATGVDKSGYSFKTGIKLWKDKHIKQLKKLAQGLKENGSLALIQLQHGGFKADKEFTDPISSSDYKDKHFKAKGMSEKKAGELVESFAQAALRAQKAGFDGIQLHGCHGYLINQFSCPSVNKRDDKYAKSSAFGCAIIKRIKELCDENFIICVRVGIDSPTVENSIQTAIDYQNAGADMLSVSAGINTTPFKAPEGWKYSDISYMAKLVKERVHVPVVGVCNITNAKIANGLLALDALDMAAVGRNYLIQKDWAECALNGKEISECRHCSKGCYYFGQLKKCPAVELGKKKGIL